MATFNEIVYDIRENIRELSDDSKLSNSNLGYIFENYRALLIIQDLRKRRFSHTNLIQDLEVVDMELVDAAEDCNITAGCKILKSVEQLPRPIESDDKPLITFIGGMDKGVSGNKYTKNQEQFQLVPWARFSWLKYQKYTGDLAYASIKDNYLYIINNKTFVAVNVQGIFESPRDAARFHTCTGESCYSDNNRYPIDRDMIPIIKDMMWQKELSIYKRLAPDTTNNNKDESEQERSGKV